MRKEFLKMGWVLTQKVVRGNALCKVGNGLEISGICRMEWIVTYRKELEV